MSPLADRVIAALATEHDSLARLVPNLGTAQLSGPSGASEWTVAQVLSHLGSAAEITLAGLQAGLGERSAPDESFNPSVWDRWNAMAPAAQRDGYLEHDAALIAAFDALDPQQRASLQLPVGFLPAPLAVAGFAGMRLNEAAAHGWDVRVGLDPAAGVLPDSAATLAELFAGDLGFLLGFVGKADLLGEPATVEIPSSGHAIVVADTVSFVAAATDPTATFQGPLEAAIRLLTGRLAPEHTPAEVSVAGNVTLDELRAVFPGF